MEAKQLFEYNFTDLELFSDDILFLPNVEMIEKEDGWKEWTFFVDMDDKIKPALRDSEGIIHSSPYIDSFKVGLPNASF